MGQFVSGIGEGLTGVFYPTGLLDILFSLFCWQTGATPVGGVDGAGGDADQLPGGEGPHELLRRQAPRLRRPLRRKSAKGPAGVSLPSPPCPPPDPPGGGGAWPQQNSMGGGLGFNNLLPIPPRHHHHHGHELFFSGERRFLEQISVSEANDDA